MKMKNELRCPLKNNADIFSKLFHIIRELLIGTTEEQNGSNFS